MYSPNLVVDPTDLWDKDIFTLLGLENAPEQTKKEILANMTATINNRVLARVLDQLDDNELKEYEDLLDRQEDQKIIDYLKSKNVDLMKLVAEEAMIYKLEILNLAQGDNGSKE